MRYAGIRSAAALLCIAAGATSLKAQTPDSLDARIQKVMARPEFAHSNFGIEFYDLETGKVVYSLNADKLFVPASTTKLLTEGALLAQLGPDYRFHTRVYRTGPIDKKGTLKGNLIFVASGDPNLSNRIQTDGTLGFMDDDHSYNGPALPGDPLAVIKDFAAQVAAKGIRKIEGRVYVDTSLMPDGEHEGGTGVTMSSIIVNDNIIDLTATAGAKPGDPVTLGVSPQTSYFHFVNGMTTGPADSKVSFDATDPAVRPDGSWEITFSGNVPQGSGLQTVAYQIPSPTPFAVWVLGEALAAKGIEIKAKKSGAVVKDFSLLQHFYTAENQVAEHVSPPLSEEIKITLKVSQNLHAGMGPYFLGLLGAKNSKDPLFAGFKLERAFLADAKLDLSGASQGDGAGGDWADLFSPDFLCHYLAYWKTRPDFPIFFNGLPILGKDGTLAKIQKDSPGAGHVFAKTGTFAAEDKLNSRLMLNGKGLAGYVQTKSGKTLAFAAYVNHVAMPADPESAQKIAGQALGEIAAAAYDAPLP
ncbi:MAG TPA: D-alanyl-D-alanine carboxypeptidase/D-alanyl-D-alanine-endopeptidase [Candidatus Acidoferrum sp.]|nr:D-alanyl-D-alanine carboxypeptidase/D-alanyl-D-alanine-endopeptidase [Candidatus Acidoferrum sp.]